MKRLSPAADDHANTVLPARGVDAWDTGHSAFHLDLQAHSDSAIAPIHFSQPMDGTSGNDTLVGGEGDDNLSGLGGDDNLSGLDGNDTLDGGDGDDFLQGGNDNDTLTGDAGADNLVGGAGVDHLDGGADNDTLSDFLGPDDGGVMIGGTGDDSLQLLSSGFTGGSNRVDGGDGNDTIVFENAQSFDFVNVTSVENVISQTVGNPHYTFYDSNLAAGQVMTVTMPGLSLFGASGAVIDAGTVTSWALHVQTSQIDPNGDTSVEARLSDTIVGTAGDDVIQTYFGDDTITGGLGNDTIDGGSGFDTAVFHGNYADYTITADDVHGTLMVVGPDGTDTLIGINALQFDDQTIDVVVPGQTLTGGDGTNDTLTGGEGDDTISGLGGDDTLSGADGNDALDGGTGDDFLQGNDGNDTLTGGDGDDNLVGGAGVDHLDGGADNDTVSDFLGPDDGGTMSGGTGDDSLQLLSSSFTGGSNRIDGGDGNDTIVFENAQSFDFVNVTSVENVISQAVGNPHYTFYDSNVDLGGMMTVTMPGLSLFSNHGAIIDASAVVNWSLHVDTSQIDPNGDTSVEARLSDTIIGGAGDDVINTYFGDDTITGGLGNDTIDGGSGFDTAVFHGNYADYTITADDVNGTLTVVGPDGTDTLIGINALQFDDQTVDVAVPGVTLNGSDDANDTLSGGEGNDTISGLGGDDTLSGVDGDDALDGGAGDDFLQGNDGNDTLTGGAGDDNLVGGAGVDHLDGGADNDTLSDFLGPDDGGTISGGDGDDMIGLQASGFTGGSNRVDGGAGNDTITFQNAQSFDFVNVTSVENVISQAVGNPHYTFYDSNVDPGGVMTVTMPGLSLFGATGAVIDASAVVNWALHIQTSQIDPAGDASVAARLSDNITGGAGNDVIQTYFGDDTIKGGLGDDTIDGGLGFDTAVFSGNYADYTITSDNVHGTMTVSGPDGTDTLSGINALQFDDQTVDVVVPGITLVGTDGSDSLSGGEGTDTLDGGGGNDNLAGADGDDTLTGGDGNDVVNGGDGDDTIVGGPDPGDANLRPHGNGTQATPSSGNDTFRGGSGIDTVSYATATQTVTIDLTAGTATGAEIGNDTLSGIENAIGGAGGDAITGGTQNNVLSGLGGNDSISGGQGKDTLDGGAGDDTLDGGFGSDTATYIDATSAVRVSLAVTTAQNVGGGMGHDTLVSIEYLTGSNFNDTLTGNATNNVIRGGSGDDTIDLSGGGTDSAVGADGSDVIIMGAAFDPTDRIDGGGGHDKMKLSGDYSTLVQLKDTTLTGIETIALSAGNNYDFKTNHHNVLDGFAMTVDGRALGAANTLTFDASLETSGSVILYGGAGNDVLTGSANNDVLIGGLGADHLAGGGGADHFLYRSASESTGAGFDTVTGFDASADAFDLSIGVKHLNVAVSGSLSAGTFDTDMASLLNAAHLGTHHAVLVTATAGGFAGDTFLVVDLNNVAGYQAGQDLVVMLDHPVNIGSFSTHDFI